MHCVSGWSSAPIKVLIRFLMVSPTTPATSSLWITTSTASNWTYSASTSPWSSWYSATTGSLMVPSKGPLRGSRHLSGCTWTGTSWGACRRIFRPLWRSFVWTTTSWAWCLRRSGPSARGSWCWASATTAWGTAPTNFPMPCFPLCPNYASWTWTTTS